jgi:integrase/recombinase XerD
MKPRRGRPKGIIGKAAVLSSTQVHHVFRCARSRQRHADRAEIAFALSVRLGLRARELASLVWSDVYESTGKVRLILRIKSAYTKGGKIRDVSLSVPALRRLLADYAAKHPGWLEQVPERPLFPSNKRGHMTPSSMVRFLKTLYREAGIPEASSQSGRMTLITSLVERGIDLDAIAQVAVTRASRRRTNLPA